MIKVVGIRFKRAGEIFYFDPSGIELEVGDNVVVDTARGTALGKVITAPTEVAADSFTEPLKPVLRKAQPEDLEQMEKMKAQEKEALAKCEELVAQHRLPMKLLAAEHDFASDYLTIYFKAEERVDFRALLREFSAILKTRVQLRQVGARDVAKLIGGFGRCGRQLCCASHLVKFETVSMKMAKAQNLPLNPAKISGVCGRLLCCLNYENELYHLMKQKLPQIGLNVTTSHGEAKVVGSNPLKETVLVQLESEAILELPLSQITAIDCAQGCDKCPQG